MPDVRIQSTAGIAGASPIKVEMVSSGLNGCPSAGQGLLSTPLSFDECGKNRKRAFQPDGVISYSSFEFMGGDAPLRVLAFGVHSMDSTPCFNFSTGDYGNR